MRDAPVCIVYIQQFLNRIQCVYAWCDLIDTTHGCWVMDLILVVGGDEWGFDRVLSLTSLALHTCREASVGEGCDAGVERG